MHAKIFAAVFSQYCKERKTFACVTADVAPDKQHNETENWLSIKIFTG